MFIKKEVIQFHRFQDMKFPAGVIWPPTLLQRAQKLTVQSRVEGEESQYMRLNDT